MEAATTHGELGKLRWHCRRGLLELDLVLEQFNSRHLIALDAGQRAVFRELLALGDNDLLDLVMGRIANSDERYSALLKMLRTP
jgi:succinate dehydrogenase flavin-adding protein (antitoxin of CptAB toxin-antitoxin module)